VHKIFDSHGHYTDEKFAEDGLALLDRLFDGPVGAILNCSVTYQDACNALKLARRYPGMYVAAGIHPENVEESTPEDLEKLRTMWADPKVVAVGEIGLDYHWDTPRDQQLFYFERQLQIAGELDMPVVIHDREAHGDTWELLKKYRPRGVVHCFSGSVQMAQDILGLGMYIGFTGVVTFSNARRPLEAAAAVPRDRLLLETDCPYMAPVPCRGQRCDSGMISYTAAPLATQKGVSVPELIDICAENAARLFGIKL